MATNARWVLTGLTMATVLAISGNANAAPQVLALVETPAPVELTCVDGTCHAEFSTFCLQKRRSAPVQGTLYQPAATTELTLTLTAADGSARRIPAAGYVQLRSVRTFTSVDISIRESDLRALGAVKVAVSVPKDASAVPVAVAGDRDPLSDAEIALYTGPLREIADRNSPESVERVAEARVLSRLFNANQPPSYTEDTDPKALWQRAVGTDLAVSPAIAAAAKTLRRCHAEAMKIGYFLNQCLKQEHDIIMSDTAKKVWETLDPGS